MTPYHSKWYSGLFGAGRNITRVTEDTTTAGLSSITTAASVTAIAVTTNRTYCTTTTTWLSWCTITGNSTTTISSNPFRRSRANKPIIITNTLSFSDTYTITSDFSSSTRSMSTGFWGYSASVHGVRDIVTISMIVVSCSTSWFPSHDQKWSKPKANLQS